LFNVVLPVLKRYYTRLCQCLPQDYMKTVDKLRQLFPAELPADYLDGLNRSLPTEQINERIICYLMCGMKVDDNVVSLCDIMEHLSDQNTLIESFRNGKSHIYKSN